MKTSWFSGVFNDYKMETLLGKGQHTAKNIVISRNLLVRKFCEKAQFPHSVGQIAPNYAGTVFFNKISPPGN